MPSATETSTVKKCTISEQAIPAEEAEPKKPGPAPAWDEYLRSLSAEELAKHEIYVYRREPREEGYIYCGLDHVGLKWLEAIENSMLNTLEKVALNPTTPQLYGISESRAGLPCLWHP